MSSSRQPTPLTRELGARIRKLRKKRNWTQADVEAHTNLDRGHISEMETGKRAITIVTLQTIARCFDTTMARLLRGL
ncbi:MAG TPA: helix-turn-helix transcriptional regulator [Candidatus Angelobacter sp.]|jgi:XRE family transcriptional regulator, regulator of sulfur utilization|nr:helix-turn-helix transcriptional regulator [Candidatus Angelobacter sp.]